MRWVLVRQYLECEDFNLKLSGKIGVSSAVCVLFSLGPCKAIQVCLALRFALCSSVCGLFLK